jgi:hypothetical protein
MTHDDTRRVFIHHSEKDKAIMVHNENGMLICVGREPAPKKRGATPKDQAACKAKLARLPWLDDGYAEPVEMETFPAFLLGLLLGGIVVAGLVTALVMMGGVL